MQTQFLKGSPSARSRMRGVSHPILCSGLMLKKMGLFLQKRDPLCMPMIPPFLGIPELKSPVTRKSNKVPHYEVIPPMPKSLNDGVEFYIIGQEQLPNSSSLHSISSTTIGLPLPSGLKATNCPNAYIKWGRHHSQPQIPSQNPAKLKQVPRSSFA